MKDIKYVIHKEGEHYVAQCLNVDVSSFGGTIDEAIANIAEAVELYFEDNDNTHYVPVEMALIGEKTLNV
jgi:predicted RNase H-like HicB family nuclease